MASLACPRTHFAGRGHHPKIGIGSGSLRRQTGPDGPGKTRAEAKSRSILDETLHGPIAQRRAVLVLGERDALARLKEQDRPEPKSRIDLSEIRSLKGKQEIRH